MSVDMKTLTIDSQTFEIVDAEARADIASLQAAVGSPLVASTVSAMTDHNKVYVYTGSESGYTSGNWYYWNGSAWTSGGVYNAVAINTDKTLSVEDSAADGKVTGDAIADLQSAISGGVGIPADVKEALLNCFENVAWINDDGQDYYDALEAALYPPADLVSISAVYTQSGTVYDTDTLDSLKTDLVVTAHYDDSTTATVTTYTLSGTLTVGTSTVTVSYGGKTTTFTVTVSSDTRFPVAYQGNFTTSTPSNTRVSLITEDITLQYGKTLTFTASDGYVIFPYKQYGCGTDTSKIRTAKATNEIYVQGVNTSSSYYYSMSEMVASSDSSAKILTTAGWGTSKEYAIQNSSIPEIAFSGIGLFVEKGTTSAHGSEEITVDEAKAAVTWTIG